MSKPPINPTKTAAGIATDPRTLERVIPESRRPDGSVRKQLKIRPGFTPQEDVNLFRTKRQAQIEANALPKGHIIGWAPDPTNNLPGAPLSKSAKKNAKRKEKRAEKQQVVENWEDDGDEAVAEEPKQGARSSNEVRSAHQPNRAVAVEQTERDNLQAAAKTPDDSSATEADELSKGLEKLEVR